MTAYAIHPAANMFPMLAEADLAALAEDIRVNGQGEPVVIWDGQVLDGRNRLAACELAGVEPLTRTLKACPDPVAFVLSANLRRRHLRHIDRVRLAWLRKGHWQDVLKKRQVEAGAAGAEHGAKGGRGKRQDKPLRGDSPGGVSDQRWYDLAAKETEVKGDAVKTYDEVMAAECPTLSALVNDEAMALDPASKLAREVRGERLTVETLTDALAADKGRALLDSLKKPREGKTPAPPSDTAAPTPSPTPSAPAAPVAGAGLSPQHPAVAAIASAPTRDELETAYTAANGARLSAHDAEEAGKVYQRRLSEMRERDRLAALRAEGERAAQDLDLTGEDADLGAIQQGIDEEAARRRNAREQAPAPTPAATTHEQVDLFTQAAAPKPETAAADAAEIAALRAANHELRTMNAILAASNEGYREWVESIHARINRAPETVKGTVNLDRVRKLVELAGSPSENEARNAAMLACRYIRDHRVRLVTDNPLHSSDPMEKALRELHDAMRDAGIQP